MTYDAFPILDRHTQEHIGRLLRDRVQDAKAESPSNEIDRLLAALRSADREFERDGARPREN